MATPKNQEPVQAHGIENTDDSLEKSLAFETSHSVAIDSYTPEEERRVVRKIDCVVLPLVCDYPRNKRIMLMHIRFQMCLVFFFQYLDK
jgi:hypothetical protein